MSERDQRYIILSLAIFAALSHTLAFVLGWMAKS